MLLAEPWMDARTSKSRAILKAAYLSGMPPYSFCRFWRVEIRMAILTPWKRLLFQTTKQFSDYGLSTIAVGVPVQGLLIACCCCSCDGIKLEQPASKIKHTVTSSQMTKFRFIRFVDLPTRKHCIFFPSCKSLTKFKADSGSNIRKSAHFWRVRR